MPECFAKKGDLFAEGAKTARLRWVTRASRGVIAIAILFSSSLVVAEQTSGGAGGSGSTVEVPCGSRFLPSCEQVVPRLADKVKSYLDRYVSILYKDGKSVNLSTISEEGSQAESSSALESEPYGKPICSLCKIRYNSWQRESSKNHLGESCGGKSTVRISGNGKVYTNLGKREEARYFAFYPILLAHYETRVLDELKNFSRIPYPAGCEALAKRVESLHGERGGMVKELHELHGDRAMEEILNSEKGWDTSGSTAPDVGKLRQLAQSLRAMTDSIEAAATYLAICSISEQTGTELRAKFGSYQEFFSRDVLNNLSRNISQSVKGKVRSECRKACGGLIPSRSRCTRCAEGVTNRELDRELEKFFDQKAEPYCPKPEANGAGLLFPLLTGSLAFLRPRRQRRMSRSAKLSTLLLGGLMISAGACPPTVEVPDLDGLNHDRFRHANNPLSNGALEGGARSAEAASSAGDLARNLYGSGRLAAQTGGNIQTSAAVGGAAIAGPQTQIFGEGTGTPSPDRPSVASLTPSSSNNGPRDSALGGGAMTAGGATQSEDSASPSAADQRSNAGSVKNSATAGGSYSQGGGSKKQNGGRNGANQPFDARAFLDSQKSGAGGAGNSAAQAVSFKGNSKDGTNAAAGRGVNSPMNSPLNTTDPEDYFARTSSEDDLFKTVERKYAEKAAAWALQDRRATAAGGH